jgi:chromosomal replication initiator protein
MTTLWDRTLVELRQALPSQEFAAWIACLRSLGEPSDTMTLEAPNAFHRNWVQKHHLEHIRAAIATAAGRPIPVVLAIGSAGGAMAPKPAAADVLPPGAPANSDGPALSFSTFVVGSCNELAYAAARAVAQSPGSQYNPLFIHGGVGLGKTHLLQAIAAEMRGRFRGHRVLAVKAEVFLNEMVRAIKRHEMDAFHRRFRRADALLVDDVQFIAGKDRTQEEFLHAFNLLGEARKQIVLTSDKPPRAIAQLEDGLRSRFEGGLIAEVTRPDRETRFRILERKALLLGMSLSREVLDYLADRIPALSVRELEGALTRLRAMASLGSRPVDLTLAREAVGQVYPEPCERVSAERVETLVGASLGIDPRLLATHRSGRAVFARQLAMYLLKKLLRLSLSAIGDRYGRDHTTVLHAVRVIEARRACDPEVRRLVTALEGKL